MKTKTSLSGFVLGIFAVLFLMSFVSADTIFSDNFNDGDLSGWTVSPSNNWTNPGTLANSTNTNAVASLSRTISTSGFKDIVVKYDRRTGGTWESGDGFNASWSIDGTNFFVLESLTTDSTLTSKTFNLNSSTNNNATFQLKFKCDTNAAGEFCSIDNVIVEGTEEPTEILSCDSTGNSGELKVKKIDFTNNGLKYKTFGSDDEWFPYERVEVTIQVKNEGDDDVDDVEISWGVWNTKTNEWVIDIDEEDTVDIKDGDTETVTITFQIDDDMDVDLEDLSDGENYRFYVTAQGVVDNDDSDDTCVSDFETASVIVESDFVVLDDVTIPETVQCNALVEVTVDVLNVGDRDQDDVYLEVVDLGGVLKIKESLLVGDVNAFDKERVSFTTRIPSDATEGTYSLVFSVLDEDKDIYENDFDDEQSKYTLPIKVQGNCGTSATILGTASVSATLESGGEAGKDLVVNAIITNKGTSSATFLISSSGYGAWADSATVEPGTLTLNAGESGSVSITLRVKDSASGTNTFDIEVVSGNQVATTQKVSVPITEKKGFFTGSVIGGSDNNYLLWGVGLLNVILIVAIIIVVVRIFRK